MEIISVDYIDFLSRGEVNVGPRLLNATCSTKVAQNKIITHITLFFFRKTIIVVHVNFLLELKLAWGESVCGQQ